MQITWHGHSCFTLKGSKATVVTDPYDSTKLGLKLPSLSADLVTCSHTHPGHHSPDKVSGTKLYFDEPGEYEVHEVPFTGVASWHNSKDEEDRGPNTIFAFTIDDLNVCHLGDLGHVPTTDQIDQMGDVDILLLPVGGVTTLSVKKTKELIEKIDPRVVIPMHYQLPGLKYTLGSLDEFLKELGLTAPEKLATLKIEKKDLPKDDEGLKLILLDAILA